MADTTITFSTFNSNSVRSVHEGVFVMYGSHTYSAAQTVSASQVYLALPIPHSVVIVDGFVKSSHNASYSFKASAGWTDAKSILMSSSTIDSVGVRFNGVPHEVTITATDTIPRIKPLAVTIKTAASGTLNGTMSVIAFMQHL